MVPLCQKRYLIVCGTWVTAGAFQLSSSLCGGVLFSTWPPGKSFPVRTSIYIYGGSILPETGQDLFIKAVRDLAALVPKAAPAVLYQWQTFSRVIFEAFADEIASTCDFRVTLYCNLSASEYRALASRMT